MSLKPYFARNIVKQISTRKSGSYSDKARGDIQKRRKRYERILGKQKSKAPYHTHEESKPIEDSSEPYQDD
jgi:hypothetical protein